MNIKAVRGTKDILGEDSLKYDYIVKTASEYFDKYGFQRIITPIFEETALFKRGIGEGTDIVSKEMYTFDDKGGRSCTLRPEGTASAVRAYLEHKNPKAENSKPDYFIIDQKFGTVGCVALDQFGNLAAGTSTGGMTNKKYGRIGDAPIIGAGTYADENVGISATGWGEFFIRSTAARTIAAKIQYLKKDVKTAAQETIDEIEKMGGDGGLIALDKNGNIAMPFNTSGMYRGAITEDGEIEVEIYR